MPEQKEEFTRYEITRILGARALQIAMDAPILLKISDEELEKMGYDPLKIAELEFKSGILPITVKRPLPEKTKEALKKISVVKKEEGKKKEEEIEKEDKELEKLEEKEEEEIEKEGEIMELATPEDEKEEEAPIEQAIGEE